MTSHEMGQIERLCSRATWIRDGKVVLVGDRGGGRPVPPVDDRGAPPPVRLDNGGVRLGTREIEVTQVRLLSGGVPGGRGFESGAPLDIEITWAARADVPAPIFGVSLHADAGGRLLDLAAPAR